MIESNSRGGYDPRFDPRWRDSGSPTASEHSWHAGGMSGAPGISQASYHGGGLNGGSRVAHSSSSAVDGRRVSMHPPNADGHSHGYGYAPPPSAMPSPSASTAAMGPQPLEHGGGLGLGAVVAPGSAAELAADLEELAALSCMLGGAVRAASEAQAQGGPQGRGHAAGDSWAHAAEV